MRSTLPVFLLLTACAPKQQADLTALEARVAALEATMAKVESVVELPANPEREAEAFALGMQAREALDQLDMVKARDLVERLVKDYGDTTMGRSAAEVAETLAVIGTDAGKLGGVKWVRNGEGAFREGHTTLLVFFEAWCPHCQREIPELQARWQALKDDGLDMIGLTSFSRGTTTEQMDAFLDEGEVGFPVGRDAGDLAMRYRVEGVPSAVLVRDGKVAWTGHPAEMTADTLKRFLPGS